MPQYFLCYRRDDTAGHTGRLYSDLVRELGEEEVFFDLRSIPPGMDHREATKQAIGSSSVVLVVIGRAWRPELMKNESDNVRPELETAMAGGKRIVPVLVQGTPMPAADELSEPVRSFAYLNAAEMSDRHWDADVAALVRLLRPRRPWWKSAVVGPLLIIGAGFAAWGGWQSAHHVATTSETVPPPTTSAATTAAQGDSVAALKVRPSSPITVRVVGTPNVDSYTLAVVAGDPVRVVDAPKERPQVDFVVKEQKTEVVLSAVTSRPAVMTIDVYIGSKWRRTYPLRLPAGASTKHWFFERLEESAMATDMESSTTAGTSTTSPAGHDGSTSATNTDRNVVFGPNANRASVSEFSLSVLRDIMRVAGVAKLTISGTQRSPQDQAQVMFNNLESAGVAAQKRLYKEAGQSVIDAYSAAKNAGKSADDVKAAMLAQILKIGPYEVSPHATDPRVLNIFDIAPSSVDHVDEFVAAARKDGRVAKVLTPPNDPGLHLEIPQPK